jgi:hypothetical protein
LLDPESERRFRKNNGRGSMAQQDAGKPEGRTCTGADGGSAAPGGCRAHGCTESRGSSNHAGIGPDGGWSVAANELRLHRQLLSIHRGQFGEPQF